MSTPSQENLVKRLTRERLSSYLESSDGDAAAAISLYDWNASVGSSLQADLGRLEVLFRNTVDQSLRDYGISQGWPEPWHRRRVLFAGKSCAHDWSDVCKAEERLNAKQRRNPSYAGKVITELSFGFWRNICAARYLTSLWVPALASAFPHHPEPANPGRVRSDVYGRMKHLHSLRNRIAHYEPIHQRNLAQDYAEMLEIIRWICPDCHAWAEAASSTPAILSERP